MYRMRGERYQTCINVGISASEGALTVQIE